MKGDPVKAQITESHFYPDVLLYMKVYSNAKRK